MKLNLSFAISVFLLVNISATSTKSTLDRRDNSDNRDIYGSEIIVLINGQPSYITLKHRQKIRPFDPITDVRKASVIVAPAAFACVITSPSRLPSEPFSWRNNLLTPYPEAQNLVCYIPADPQRMFSLWVRYASGVETVLFLVAGSGFGTIRFEDDFGRYITAVKIVTEPIGYFGCKLETDDGDLMFSRTDPLIGITSLTRAISCYPLSVLL